MLKKWLAKLFKKEKPKQDTFEDKTITKVDISYFVLNTPKHRWITHQVVNESNMRNIYSILNSSKNILWTIDGEWYNLYIDDLQKYEITFSKYSFAFFSFGIHKTQVIETIDNPNNIRLICPELYDWLNKFVSLYK